MPCEARPNREQFALGGVRENAGCAASTTVARASRTRNRALVGVKTENARALTQYDAVRTARGSRCIKARPRKKAKEHGVRGWPVPLSRPNPRADRRKARGSERVVPLGTGTNGLAGGGKEIRTLGPPAG